MNQDGNEQFEEPNAPQDGGAASEFPFAELPASLGDTTDAALRGIVEQLFGSDGLESLDEINLDSLGLAEDLPAGEVPSLETVMAQLEAGASELTETQSTARSRARQDKNKARYVVFAVSDSQYALPLAHVLEIQRVPGMTSIPYTPEFVLGVTNLRGEVVSVVDLGQFLGVERESQDGSGRLLVTRSQDQSIVVGLLVDKVLGIRQFGDRQITRPTAPVEDKSATYARGVVTHTEGLVVVLDCERLLNSEEMRQFETV